MLPAIYFTFSRKKCDEQMEKCADLGLITPEEKEEIRQNIQEILESRRADKEIPADLKRKYKKENHVHYDLCAYDELEIDPTGKNAQTYDYDLTASIPLIYKTFYEKVGNEKGTY